MREVEGDAGDQRGGRRDVTQLRIALREGRPLRRRDEIVIERARLEGGGVAPGRLDLSLPFRSRLVLQTAAVVRRPDLIRHAWNFGVLRD